MSTPTPRLDSLYQEIILDHYKNPHGRGLRDPYEAEVHHVNPTCGDEVTLRVHVADGVIEDVSYDAVGCSISQAAASVMTDHQIDHGDLPDVPEAGGGVATTTIDDVTEAMKDVVDPELGINVVDLGLIYEVAIERGEGTSTAVIDMTLTSAACPLTDVIQDQTNTALEGLVNDVLINWVWMPPWGPDKITDDGREQLRSLGFNV